CTRHTTENDDKVELDQFGPKTGDPLEPSLRKSIVADYVLALNPAEFTQPLPKPLNETRVTGARATEEEPNSVALASGLRLSGVRRGEQGASWSAAERAPVQHSIT